MRALAVLPLLLLAQAPPRHRPYALVGTGQRSCYDTRGLIAPPSAGSPFEGQDAQHPGAAPSYRDHADGTVSDLVTGLMWVQARGEKVSFEQAKTGAAACRTGGHTDWRMPTIQELYSLICFEGAHRPEGGSKPYLDAVFGFRYGDAARGERPIDCQDWSATEYVGTTMQGAATVFGVNFADGRIKGYPKLRGPRGTAHTLYVRYVRGNPAYGRNDFHDNGDGTVTDRATGLMWDRTDSGAGMDWPAPPG